MNQNIKNKIIGISAFIALIVILFYFFGFMFGYLETLQVKENLIPFTVGASFTGSLLFWVVLRIMIIIFKKMGVTFDFL